MTTPTVEEKSHSEEWGAWRFVSEMLSTPNPDPELARAGIYNTSKCYEQIHDFVVEQKRKAFEEGVKAERERVMEILKKTKDRVDCNEPTCDTCKQSLARNAGLDRAIYLLSDNK